MRGDVPTDLEDGKLYEIKEACVILDISRNTLRRYTEANLIRATVRVCDMKTLYRGSELRRTLQNTI